MQRAVRRLLAERRALQRRAARGNELESNQLELERRQQELAHVLISRCLGRPDRDAP